MSTRLVIIGAGGSARDVLDIVDACNEARGEFDVAGFVVDPAYGAPGTIVNDRPVLGGFDWLLAHAGEVHAICAVGAPELRRRLCLRAAALGVRFCNVIHPRVESTRWVRWGTGVSIGTGSIITNRVVIGDHVQVNNACTIAHDCALGDYATLAPGVRLSGNVTLGEGAYVGTGASVIERRRIGAWSVVGAGAAVVRDVPDDTVAVGVPCRPIKSRPKGWHLS
jgi:sugar O-acyltransferase (sialic acid O-acetyltransferase NeuD family)